MLADVKRSCVQELCSSDSIFALFGCLITKVQELSQAKGELPKKACFLLLLRICLIMEQCFHPGTIFAQMNAGLWI